MDMWNRHSTEVQKEFLDACGNIGATMDGVYVNTLYGWREVKVGLISKRLFGDGVLPSQWDTRQLPELSTCVAFAVMEESGEFQQRWQYWRRHLRLGSTSDISALGDGAAWIWNIIHDVFGSVRECLDVYHCLEHLSDAGKVLYGEGTES